MIENFRTKDIITLIGGPFQNKRIIVDSDLYCFDIPIPVNNQNIKWYNNSDKYSERKLNRARYGRIGESCYFQFERIIQ